MDEESGWNPRAANPSSGAYGIPQAMPGSKMASAGPDWPSSAATQIRWGLNYIKNTYGSPPAHGITRPPMAGTRPRKHEFALASPHLRPRPASAFCERCAGQRRTAP